MHAVVVLLASCFIWLTFLSSALAATFGGNEKPGERHYEDHVMAGMKGVTVSERTHTREGTIVLNGFGAAGFGEATLLHDRLALELAFVVTAAGDEVSYGAEPLIKAPLHLSRWLEPYTGVGPMVVHVRDGRGQRFWMGGAQLVIGTYLWLAKALGLDLDVTFGAAHGPEMSVMEMMFAIGPILRN